MRFLALDQDHTEALVNLFGVVFPEDQMGFLAGAAAALTSRTGVVAAVCESSSLDAMRRYCEGFRRGAQHVDAGVRTIVTFRDEGSSTMLFRDSDWGQEAASDAIQAGADVILGVGGGTGQAALRAAAESGAYAIGAEQDQWFALPEARPLLVTSVYADAEAAVIKWSPLLLSGTVPAGEAVAPIALAPFHDLALTIPGERREQLNAILADLESGALETGVPAHRPE
jgi:basic membrane protein A